MPEIRTSVEREGAATSGHDDRYDRQAVFQGYGLNIGERRRLQSTEFMCHILECSARDFLAHDFPAVVHAEQADAAQTVQHGADGLDRLGALSGRPPELQAF